MCACPRAAVRYVEQAPRQQRGASCNRGRGKAGRQAEAASAPSVARASTQRQQAQHPSPPTAHRPWPRLTPQVGQPLVCAQPPASIQLRRPLHGCHCRIEQAVLLGQGGPPQPGLGVPASCTTAGQRALLDASLEIRSAPQRLLPHPRQRTRCGWLATRPCPKGFSPWLVVQRHGEVVVSALAVAQLHPDLSAARSEQARHTIQRRTPLLWLPAS